MYSAADCCCFAVQSHSGAHLVFDSLLEITRLLDRCILQDWHSAREAFNVCCEQLDVVTYILAQTLDKISERVIQLINSDGCHWG